MSVKIINEGNSVSSSLPKSIDSFLQDFAQMYGKIGYGDIISFGDNYKEISKDKKSKLRNCINNIKDACKETGLDIYDAAEDYDDVKDNCEYIVNLVRSTSSKKTESVKTESAYNKFSIKQLCFDVAIVGDSLDTSYKSDFYKNLNKFLASQGMRMAGDLVDVEDISDMYTTTYKNDAEVAELFED